MEGAAIVVDTSTTDATNSTATNTSYVDSTTGVTHYVYDAGDPEAGLFNNITYA